MSENRGFHVPDQLRKKMEQLKKIELPQSAVLLKKVRDFLEAKSPFKRKNSSTPSHIRVRDDRSSDLPRTRTALPQTRGLVSLNERDSWQTRGSTTQRNAVEGETDDNEKRQLEQYVRAIADNITFQMTGHREGVDSRLTQGQIKDMFQKGDIVFPVINIPKAGHWGGIVLAFDEERAQAIIMDSYFQQGSDVGVTVNKTNHVVKAKGLVRTIRMEKDHFLYFTKARAGSMLTKQIDARIGTDLVTDPYLVEGDLHEVRSGGDFSLVLKDVEGVAVRQAYNRALYGDDDVDLSEIMPHLNRIPTQRNLHACGAHSVITAAMAQIALEALFINKVRTKEKRIEKISQQVDAIKTYKQRITSAEDLLLEFVPALHKKPSTPAMVEQERRKLRQMVIKLFPSPGVKAGLELIR